ncbi:hypothetical protein TBLA_0B01550 [Henningerozyma blattae CBS 6284]|uniref:Protein-serine/threonine kinase n=1 Tax=Henningerozyma blattae (strain ATCC 34711 / CBS 6284 / DSM 70876 / NBRC 10599 / NRRL Y-10934 / UCD 77-7) TaxID=1071380 RepID=I2GXZ6_HENB6|nr:hypothetical protein TBLA_0B01550 [Tetrapisispora blattae CBS 6284]CCH58998.1 hypothetical protein TBLA_0B01550 [Tetrapisispora blattae CBS 6284]
MGRFIFSKVLKRYQHLNQLPFLHQYQIRTSLTQLIQDYSHKSIPNIDYAYLTNWNSSIKPHSNEQYNLSINTIYSLLVYVCRRLNSIHNLPYIVVINPYISNNNSVYLKSLESLLSLEYPYQLQDDNAVRRVLNEFLDDHQDSIMELATGFKEVGEFYDRKSIKEFLDAHLKDRIIMKLLATHYLKLIESDDNGETNTIIDPSSVSHKGIGVINTNFNVSDLVNQVSEYVGDLTRLEYDRAVPVQVETNDNNPVEFSCIGAHLEYILTEVLKNSSLAQIRNGKSDVPIMVQITKGNCGETLSIRVRDHGGGIPPEREPFILDYAYTSEVNKHEGDPATQVNQVNADVPRVAGLGFGLPLCRMYAELFGGSLSIQSLWGLGTDVYIIIKGITNFK